MADINVTAQLVEPIQIDHIPAPTTNDPPHKTTIVDIHLWHHHVGHFNYQSLSHMSTKELVARIPHIPLVKQTCTSYMLGKLPRDRMPKKRHTYTTKPLQLVHNDLCGSMPVTSRNKNRYILTFIKDFSRKNWLYFLAEKSPKLDYFQ